MVGYARGQTYFLRHTTYDAETQMLQMSPDLPPDDLVVFFAQQELS